MKSSPAAGGAGRRPGRQALLVVAVVLLAANLRPAITAVGPLIGEIRGDLGIGDAVAGLLTTLPLIGFASGSPLAPRLAGRFGVEVTLAGSLAALTAGILLRSLPAAGALFAGTVLLGLAIACGNVLLPSLVKRDFPHRVGLMTGVYLTALGLLSAIAPGVSVPIASRAGLGWRGSLAAWAALSIPALALWLVTLRLRFRPGPRSDLRPEASRARPLGSPLAWQVTVFFGLSSLAFYVTVTWLPEILQDRGYSREAAGWLVSISQLVALAATFGAPLLAARVASQRRLVVAASAIALTGYLGFLAVPGLTPLWVVLFAFAQNATFGLALTFLVLRSRDSQGTASLSGMAQTGGYLLGAAGPVAFGALHDAAGGWAVPLLVLAGLTVVMLGAGLGAGRAAYVG